MVGVLGHHDAVLEDDGAAMKTVYDVLAWTCFAMMAAGFGGGMLLSAYAQWVGGHDCGAPFNPLAGLCHLIFLGGQPLILIAMAIGFAGTVGMMAVAPRSRYAAKAK